jgi:hypothetical protein
MWFLTFPELRLPVKDTCVLPKTECSIEYATEPSRSVEFFVEGKSARIENTAPFSLPWQQFAHEQSGAVISVRVYGEKGKKGSLVETSTLKLTARVVPSTPSEPSKDMKKEEANDAASKSKNASNGKTIYKEQFTEDIGSMLQRNKYWVFAWGVKSTPPYGQLDPRFVKIPGGIKITCLAGDGDYSGRGLNPRAELRVEGYKLPVGVPLYASITMRACQQSSGFEFFQIMSTGGGSFPVLQLEVRKGSFGVRQNTFKALVPHPLFAEHQKRVQWRIEFVLHGSNGYFRVYADNQLVWSFKGKTVYDGASSAWTQYGVYRNAGTSQNQAMEVYGFELGPL